MVLARRRLAGLHSPDPTRVSDGSEHWDKAPPILVAPNCYDPVGVGGGLLPQPGGRSVTGCGSRDGCQAISPCGGTWWHRCFESSTCPSSTSGTPPTPSPTVPARGAPPSLVGDCGFPPARTILRPSVLLPEMHKSFTDVSIGVIMQSDHPYNAAKTETNAVELASMGLPLVAATNHTLYRNVPGRVPIDAPPSVTGSQVLLDGGLGGGVQARPGLGPGDRRQTRAGIPGRVQQAVGRATLSVATPRRHEARGVAGGEGSFPKGEGHQP